MTDVNASTIPADSPDKEVTDRGLVALLSQELWRVGHPKVYIAGDRRTFLELRFGA